MRNSYLSLRVGQTPVASYYLANFMTCLRGNQISRAFQCEPPVSWGFSLGYLIVNDTRWDIESEKYNFIEVLAVRNTIVPN